MRSCRSAPNARRWRLSTAWLWFKPKKAGFRIRLPTREVEDIPLNGRQVYQLVTEEPGVTATNAPVVSSVPSPTASVTFNFGFIANGSTPRGNNFVLDGTSNNNEWLGGTPLIYPSLDAIQEVQVQTLNFSAEYGRNNGAIVNVITKSGTNEYHGDCFIPAGIPLSMRETISTRGKRPVAAESVRRCLRRSDQKNKTFLFMDYEGSRLTDSLPAAVITETPYTLSLATPGSLAAMFFRIFPDPPVSNQSQIPFTSAVPSRRRPNPIEPTNTSSGSTVTSSPETNFLPVGTPPGVRRCGSL